MPKPDESILIDTAALRAAIESADVSAEFRAAFLGGLTDAGVFAGETVEASRLGQVITVLLTENRVSLDTDFGTMMGIISLMKRPTGIYRAPVLIPIVRLRAVMDEAPVSTDFFLDCLAGLIEAGVFAGETIDSFTLGMAIGRLVADGKVSDGADFEAMRAALIALDPDIVIQ